MMIPALVMAADNGEHSKECRKTSEKYVAERSGLGWVLMGSHYSPKYDRCYAEITEDTEHTQLLDGPGGKVTDTDVRIRLHMLADPNEEHTVAHTFEVWKHNGAYSITCFVMSIESSCNDVARFMIERMGY